MTRHSSEKKAEALKLVNEIGVRKAREQLNISLQTLYKWKNEAKQSADGNEKMTVDKKPVKSITQDRTIQGLLTADDGAAEAIEALQSENIRLMAENSSLRTMNQKLREALSIFVK